MYSARKLAIPYYRSPSKREASDCPCKGFEFPKLFTTKNTHITDQIHTGLVKKALLQNVLSKGCISSIQNQ